MAYDPLNPDNDPFGPPAISTIVHCIHCGEEYDSYKIEWRVERDADGVPHGFWCCPIAGCDGKGFGFDIFPIDPEYRDENGELMWCGDEEDEDEELAEFDDEDAEFDLFSSEFGAEDDGEDWLPGDETPAEELRRRRDDDLPF